MPADLTERVIRLRTVPIFADLSPRVLHALAGSLRAREFEDGEVVMPQGVPPEALQIVSHGHLALRQGPTSLVEFDAQHAGFGLLGMLAGLDSVGDVIAKDDLATLELDRESLFELMEDQPSFLRATLKFLNARTIEALEQQESPAPATPWQDEPPVVDVPSYRGMSLVERMLYLRTFAPFSRTNLTALTALTRILDEVRFEPGQALWAADDPASTTLLVVRGTLECRTRSGRVFHQSAGSVAGGLECLAGAPRWYGATTVSPVVALEGHTHDYFALLEDDFAMALDTVRLAAAGLLTTLQRSATGGSGDAAEDLSTALL